VRVSIVEDTDPVCVLEDCNAVAESKSGAGTSGLAHEDIVSLAAQGSILVSRCEDLLMQCVVEE
jgi:hypothetical protein